MVLLKSVQNNKTLKSRCTAFKFLTARLYNGTTVYTFTEKIIAFDVIPSHYHPTNSPHV